MEKAGLLAAVCIGEETGKRKRPVPRAELRIDFGVVGDCHAGSGRQVSLLAEESIAKMRAKGLAVGPGDFAENLTTRGLALHSLPVGTRIRIGEAVDLELTQIGKECHAACEIRRTTGSCIMPSEGVFARVLAGGEVKPGDGVQVLPARSSPSGGSA
jgi:MOSC domain-containing protein YiiM